MWNQQLSAWGGVGWDGVSSVRSPALRCSVLTGLTITERTSSNTVDNLSNEEKAVQKGHRQGAQDRTPLEGHRLEG